MIAAIQTKITDAIHCQLLPTDLPSLEININVKDFCDLNYSKTHLPVYLICTFLCCGLWGCRSWRCRLLLFLTVLWYLVIFFLLVLLLLLLLFPQSLLLLFGQLFAFFLFIKQESKRKSVKTSQHKPLMTPRMGLNDILSYQPLLVRCHLSFQVPL